MPIAHKLQEFLAANGVQYDLVPHPRTFTSMEKAATAHVPGDRLAKAVALKDQDGYVLAVLPSTHRVELRELESALHRQLDFAAEEDVSQVFNDCERGAVPAAGAAYGVATVLDDSLVETPDVFFEAGDLTELVHLRCGQFRKVMSGARCVHFSHHI